MADHHFTSIEIKGFTSDSIEQQMIEKFGLVCPSCSMYLLKNYCPDCGRKTIIPNFCTKCNIESDSQFCENCGSAVYKTGMDARIYDYLSGHYLEREIDIKLVSLASMLSDIQTQISSFGELELQTLTGIKKEIILLSKKINMIDEKIERIEKSISNFVTESENSVTILNERISEFGNYLVTKVGEIDNKVIKIDEVSTEIYSHVNELSTELVESYVIDIKGYFNIL